MLSHQRNVRTLIGLLLIALSAPGVSTPANAGNAPQDSLTTEDPINNTPRVSNGRVYAIAKVGGTVVVGGTFSAVQSSTGGLSIARNYIMAFDELTGAVSTTFVPTLDGTVNALAASPDGKSVYVGGAFRTVNGVAQRGVTRLNVSTGERYASFNARTTSAVNDVVYNSGQLYIGGSFTQVNGTARLRMAGLDAETGALLAGPNSDIGVAFQGSPTVAKVDVSPDGSRLVAIGSFTIIDGQSRMQIAQWDLAGANATLSTWQTDRFGNVCEPSFYYYLRDVDFSPDGSYFAVVSTGAYRRAPALCDSTSRWEGGTSGANQQPTWVNYTGGDSLWSVAVTATAVYNGGHSRWQNNSWASNAAGDGAVDRDGIAALDPLTGMPLRWNPTRERGVGAFALVATADRLYVGSDTNSLGHEYHPRLGALPLFGGRVPVQPTDVKLPVTFHHVRGNEVRDVDFDGATATDTALVDSSLEPASILGAFSQRGHVYYVTGDGRFYSRTWDGASAGVPLDLITDAGYPTTLPRGWTDRVRSLAFSRGRIYYTKLGSDSVFWRWFGLDASVLGAEEFIASTSGGSAIRGFEIIGDRAYLAWSDGRFYSASVTASGAVGVAGRYAIDKANGTIPWGTSGDFWTTQADGPLPPLAAGALKYGAFVRTNDGETEEQAIQRFESQVDRPLDVVRVFRTWDEAFPSQNHNWLRDSGHDLVLSVYPMRSNATRVSWSEIANAAPGSAVYAEIVSWAQRVRDFGAPISFSFHHEPETVEDIPFGTDDEFIAAYRKVVEIFRNNNADKVEFMWIMTSYSFLMPLDDRRAAPLWYPGDDVVDQIGADAYNWSRCRTNEQVAWETPDQILGGLRTFGTLHPEAELWLSEFASTEDIVDPNRKATWMTELRALLKLPGWEQFEGVLHFNQVHTAPGTNCQWWVDSSPATLAAVQALAADEFFGGDGTPPPPPPLAPEPDVVFVVGNPLALNAADVAAVSHMSQGGRVVEVIDDAVVQSSDATGVKAVVISASSSESPAARLREITTPILTWKPYTYDDLRMTGTVALTDYGSTNATQIVMSSINHPLRAGLNGTQTITTTTRSIAFGRPLASADVIAYNGSNPTLFVYQSGDVLTVGTAPGCRIGFPGGSAAMDAFTATGWSLFATALDYAIGGCG